MIGLDLGFQIDSKGLSSQISSIQREIKTALSEDKGFDLRHSLQQAKNLEKALARATGADGTVSFVNLNSQLRQMGTTAGQLTTQLALGGAAFKDSIVAANNALIFSNRNSLVLSDRIHNIAHTIKQSFKYSMAQALFRSVSKFATQSLHWVKDLNESITQIGVVTGKSGQDLDKATEKIIKGAKELKVAAKDYADASFIFYQQGLGDKEVERRTEITIKAARAAGQEVGIMSEQLTAVWNTYQMNAEQQANAASVGAKLAASTAAEFSDISSAMQLSAAAAEQMGVSYNSLAAIIATVKDTTQQSASIIGNAYKTIFSRFEQLKSAGTDGEVTLGQVSKQLQNLGVQVLDNAGNLRQLDQVINEVGTGWDKFTEKQQLAIAQAVGGTRQYGQFLALMNNFDKYQKNLAIANAEMGTETLDQQYQKSLDSIEAIQTRINETFSRAGENLFSEEDLKGALKIVQTAADTVESITDAIGGWPQLIAIIALAMRSKIAPQLDNIFNKVMLTYNSATPEGRKKNEANMWSQREAEVNRQIQAYKLGTQQHTEAIVEKDRLNLLKQISQKELEIQEAKKRATGADKERLELLEAQLKAMTEQLLTYTTLASETHQSFVKGVRGLDTNDSVQRNIVRDFTYQDRVNAGKITGQAIGAMDKVWGGDSQQLATVKSLMSGIVPLQEQSAELKAKLNELTKITVANTFEEKSALGNVVAEILEQLLVDERIPVELEEQIIALKEIYNKTEAVKEVSGEVLQEDINHTVVIESKARAYQKIHEQLGQGADKSKLWSGILSGTAQTVSSLTLGFSGLVNMVRTFGDEASTAGDKLMAIGFGLPMIVGAGNSLVKMVGALNASGIGQSLIQATGSKNIFGATLGASINGLKGIASGKGFKSGVLKGDTGTLNDAWNGLLAEQRGISKKYISTDQFGNTIYKPFSQADKARYDAISREITALNSMTEADYAAAKSATVTTAAISAFAIVIAAVVAAMLLWNKALSENTRIAKENLDETIEAANAIDDQTKAVNENYAAWRKAVEAGEDAAQTYSTLSKSLAELSTTLSKAGISASEYQSAINMALQTGNTAQLEALENRAKASLQNQKLEAAKRLGRAQDFEKEHKWFIGDNYYSAATGYDTYGKSFSEIRNDIAEMEKQAMEYRAKGDLVHADNISNTIDELKKKWGDEIANAEQAAEIALGYYEDIVRANEDALNSENYEQSLGSLQKLYKDLKDNQVELGLTDEEVESRVRLAAMQNETLSRTMALLDKSTQFGTFNEETKVEKSSYVDATNGLVVDTSKEVTETTYEAMEGLQELINKMDETEQDIFLSLDAKLFESADSIEKAIEAIKEYRKELKDTYETQEQLQGRIDKANNLQSGLKSAIEEMKESGEVSVDTAEELIEAGLGNYLTEVNDKFYLTKAAANDFNSSLDEEREAVSRLLEGTTDLKGPVNEMNEMLIQLASSDKGGTFGNIADNFIKIGKTFMDSEGSVENFSVYIKDIRAELANFNPGDFADEETQENFVALQTAIGTGLAGAIQKANAALSSGAIKFTDFQKIISSAAETELDSLKSRKQMYEELQSQYDKGTDEWKKVGEQIDAVDTEIKELEESLSNSEVFNSFFDKMYDNVESLVGILNDDYSFKIGVEIDQTKFDAIKTSVDEALSSLKNYQGELPDDLARAQEYLTEHSLDMSNITSQEMQSQISTLLSGTHEMAEQSLMDVQTNLGQVLSALGDLVTNFRAEIKFYKGNLHLENIFSDDPNAEIGSIQIGGGLIGKSATKFSQGLANIGKGLASQAGNSLADGNAKISDFLTDGTAAIGSDFRNNGLDKGGSKAEADYIKRYENIERAIDKCTKAANRYKEAADDAFGKTKIIALQKYEQELQKIGKLNQQLLDEAQRYQQIDKAALEQQINSAGGPQVSYDSNGRVNNAEDIRKYWHEAVNNSGSEAVKEVADKVIKLLDELLGSEDKVEEVWDESLSNIRDWMSNKLEVVKQQIERAEKIADTEIKRFEMMNDLLGDMALSDGSVFKNLKGVFEQNVAKSTSISAATDRLLEIQSNIESGSKHEQWFKDQFGPEAWDAYISGNGAVPAELEDMLREQLESLMDLATEMKQNLADMFEAFQDTLQFFLDQYDDIAKEMKNNFQYLDRLEAIMDATSFGKTKEGLETKAKISRAREEQTQRDIDFAMSKRNVAKEAMDQAEAVMKAAMNGKMSIDQLTDAEKIAYDLARKNFNEARDTFYQTEEDLTEALNNGLEQAKETLEIMNQLAEKTFSDKIGGFSLDSLKDEYDMQKTMDNFYLDAYEKEYSLSKLENEIAEQMKDVDDPSRLKAWGEFQDKLNGLRANGVKLTQDEYEILEAEFELEKLRDQYEEAKNAKNTMRLARDASGNYSYVYSSNSKEVNKLAQQIKDAEHNIYEMHKNIEQEMQDSWWELQEWYKNNIENFDKELYETDAKYKAYIDAGQAYYEMMNARYAGQITTHTDAIGIKFEETATGKVLPACQTMDQAAHDFKVAFCGEDGNGGYKGALIAANNDYLASVKSLAEEFGIDMADMRQTAETEIDKINEKNDELIDKLTGDDGVEAAAKNALKSAGTNLKSFVTNEFLPNMQKILDKIAEVTKALNDFENRESGSVDVDTPETPEIPGTPETPGTPGTPGTPSSPSSPTNDDWWKAEYNAAKSYDVSYIKAAQRRMGLKGSDVDGSWGPASQTLAKQLYGTYSFAKVWEKLKAEDQGDEWDKNGEYMAVGGNLHEGTVYHSEELEATKFEGTNYWKIKGTNFYAKQSDLVEDRVNGNRQFYVPANTKYYVIKKTASGGLISTPQIRSLAEEGPELVLNAEDTKNILATVKMMREVVARQSNAVRGADFASRVSSDFFNQHQTVDQDVKIEATFPNVSMASEIEAAFNNLINEAVQYATRR